VFIFLEALVVRLARGSAVDFRTEAAMSRKISGSTSLSISKAVRLAILVAFCSLALGSIAWAHDDDYYRGAEHYACQNGYRDGLRHGHFDRTEQHRYNIHSQQYNDANQGYDRSMGPFSYYKRAYRDGYASGYAEGFNSWRRDGDAWRDRQY
jgi:hypothetical protein